MTIARPGARILAGAPAFARRIARRPLLAAVGVLALAGCSVQVHRGGAASAAETAPLALEPRAQRDAQHALFLADLHRGDSLPTGDAGAVAAARWFADDAVYLYPGLPVVQGREAVRQLLAQAGAGARVLRFQPLRVEVSRDGSFGYSVGYALRAARDTAARVRLDRYQAAWARTGDAWRIVAYSELPAGPLPPARVDEGSYYRATQSPATDTPAAAGRAAADAWAADRAFAADAPRIGTGMAFARWAAADAMLAGGGGELGVGPTAILRTWGEPVPGASLAWGPVFARGAASGDLAVTVGEAVAIAPGPDGKPVSRPSKYLTVWRRTAQGMRWVTDGGNAR